MLPNSLPDINTELSDEQKQALALMKQQIPKVKEAIRRAKAAGIDVAAQEQELAQQEKQLDALIKVYVRHVITPPGA